ncbi:MAG: amino acid ABC transporter permease [Devosia sp.]
MDLHFNQVLAHFPLLAAGFMLTVQLSLSAIILGGSLGLLAAMYRSMAPRAISWPVDVYVELIRNTPFLVQLYIIFFGLPSMGFRLDAWQAGLLAMTINLGAYSTEIFRAGIESIHRTQLEAGAALALTRLQIFRRIVLKPAVGRIWPSLASQFILLMLTSSVCSFVSVEELSGAANTIQSATFRSLETYFIAGVMYLGLAIAMKAFLFWLGGLLFTNRVKRAPAVPVSGPLS